jgi:carbon monoxide dehydrogenase subunit G
MSVIENRVEIARSPEDVFDYLADLRNELEWNPDVQSMEKLTDGPVGLGTRYRAKWSKSRHIICECTRFDRPSGWTYVNGGPIEVTLDVTLEPSGDGTTLRASFSAHPKGIAWVFFPVFVRIMRRIEKENTVNLKAALERGPGVAAGVAL